MWSIEQWLRVAVKITSAIWNLSEYIENMTNVSQKVLKMNRKSLGTSNFDHNNEAERLMKVIGSHARRKTSNVSKTVQNRDIIYYGPLIGNSDNNFKSALIVNYLVKSSFELFSLAARLA